MIDMDTKGEQILIGLLLIAITAVFTLGMIMWPSYPKDGTWIGNLYYVTTSSVLYFLSLVVFMLAKSKIVKAASYLCLAIFSVNLYVELYLDPTNWTAWSLGLIIFVAVNLFLTAAIIERLKKNKKK